MKMKKQTIYIILGFLCIIVFCVIFGKSVINEGNITMLPSVATLNGDTVNFNGALSDLKFIEGEKEEKDAELKTAQLQVEKEKKKLELTKVMIERSAEDARKVDKDTIKAMDNIINSRIPPPIYNLKLHNNTKDTAGKIEGYSTNQMKDGKKCTYFENRMDRYISMPFTITPNFSICFWIYLDENDQNYYTVASVTNTTYWNPSVQIDIWGGRILVYNALPRNQWWGVVQDSLVNNKTYRGWTHIAYTFDQNVSDMKEKVKVYVNRAKIYSQNNYSHETPSPLNYKDNNGNDIILPTSFFNDPNLADDKQTVYKYVEDHMYAFQPNTLILGRSGDHGRAYRGYVHDFQYFASTLSPEDILRIYNATIDTP